MLPYDLRQMGQVEVRLRCSSLRQAEWMVCPHGSTAVGRTLSNRYSQHTCTRPLAQYIVSQGILVLKVHMMIDDCRSGL
jgi:hypothetical protein